MIINNKCPNVRVFPLAQKTEKGTNYVSIFLFPGVNGGIPDGVADSEQFKEQTETGLLAVIPQKKDAAKVDATRLKLSPDQIAKVPDEDVVEVMLDLDEKKALALLPDVVKRPTLVALKAREKRASIIAAIEKQVDDIDKMNIPPKK